jgi:hypothetical protein
MVDDRPQCTYEVALLNIDPIIAISDDRVLPFQAMTLLQPLFAALQSVMRIVNRQAPTLDMPAEGGIGALSVLTFKEAALPYALAVQTSISLSGHWACTDTWTFKYSITPDDSAATPLVPPKKNFRTPGLHVGPQSSPTQLRVEERYQGIWWGGERIWVDDVVRLEVPRCDLVPNGNDKILPVEGVVEEGIDPGHTPGPGDRGLFLRITGIFFAEGTARISGEPLDLVTEEFPAPSQGGSSDVATVEWAHDGLKLSPPNFCASSGQHARSWNPPETPLGFKFRSILKGGWEAVMDLSLLGGRYYPGVLANSLLLDHLSRSFMLKESVDYIYALEGLVPGYCNAIDPELHRGGRQVMLSEAVVEAQIACEEWFDDIEV